LTEGLPIDFFFCPVDVHETAFELQQLPSIRCIIESIIGRKIFAEFSSSPPSNLVHGAAGDVEFSTDRQKKNNSTTQNFIAEGNFYFFHSNFN
jgi:hypothetical protein